MNASTQVSQRFPRILNNGLERSIDSRTCRAIKTNRAYTSFSFHGSPKHERLLNKSSGRLKRLRFQLFSFSNLVLYKSSLRSLLARAVFSLFSWVFSLFSQFFQGFLGFSWFSRMSLVAVTGWDDSSVMEHDIDFPFFCTFSTSPG